MTYSSLPKAAVSLVGPTLTWLTGCCRILARCGASPKENGNRILSDSDNRQLGLKARDLVKITYDQFTLNYSVGCGDKTSYVALTLSPKMAALFGLEKDEAPDAEVVVEVSTPQIWKRDDEVTREDYIFARRGYPIFRLPPKLPLTVESVYPVTMSLGTNNMYVKTDLTEDAVIIDGKRSNILSTIPVDWANKGSSVHQPIFQQFVKVNKNIIHSIRVQVLDYKGERVKFMSNDNTPVIIVLKLKRKQAQ
jgi:hypothetical protein